MSTFTFQYFISVITRFKIKKSKNFCQQTINNVVTFRFDIWSIHCSIKTNEAKRDY